MCIKIIVQHIHTKSEANIGQTVASCPGQAPETERGSEAGVDPCPGGVQSDRLIKPGNVDLIIMYVPVCFIDSLSGMLFRAFI